MNISTLINELNEILQKHGDLETVTCDYNGGDYNFNDAKPGVEIEWGDTEIVVIRGRGTH